MGVRFIGDIVLAIVGRSGTADGVSRKGTRQSGTVSIRRYLYGGIYTGFIYKDVYTADPCIQCMCEEMCAVVCVCVCVLCVCVCRDLSTLEYTVLLSVLRHMRRPLSTSRKLVPAARPHRFLRLSVVTQIMVESRVETGVDSYLYTNDNSKRILVVYNINGNAKRMLLVSLCAIILRFVVLFSAASYHTTISSYYSQQLLT
jgi:hypothetical protein